MISFPPSVICHGHPPLCEDVAYVPLSLPPVRASKSSSNAKFLFPNAVQVDELG